MRYRTGTHRSLRNPYYPTREKPRKPLPRGIWYGLFGVISVLVACGVLLYTPKLKIEAISIEGNRLIAAQEIETIVSDAIKGSYWYRVRRDHILFLPVGGIERSIISRYPLKDVTLTRDVKKMLHVKLVERDPVARVVIKDTKVAVVDEEGKAVFVGEIPFVEEKVSSTPNGIEIIQGAATSTPTSGKQSIQRVAECIFCDTMRELPLIYTAHMPPSIRINESILSSDQITRIKTIIGLFTTNGFPIASITIDDELPENVDIRLVEGFGVYVDTSKSIETQYGHFKMFIDQKFPKPPRKLEYVDVRYSNRLYYQ